MSVRFSVILPTSGRPSFEKALASLETAGITRQDEVLVVCDAPALHYNVLGALHASPVVSQALVSVIPMPDGPHHDKGGAARNVALDMARGTHVLYLDDDDAFTDGALKVMRGHVEASPDQAHVFRMDSKPHGLLWRAPELQLGNVGGPQFVAPLEASRAYRWDSQICNDYRYMVQVTDELGGHDRLLWHEEIIYIVKP